MRLVARGWLPVLNGAVALFIAGALAAPLLGWAGSRDAADALYGIYRLTCHQWAFRSFFLFGGQALYSPEQLQALGVDPFGFVGQPGLGWKMAFCERDLAIYLAALVIGLAYAAQRGLPHLSMSMYGLLILPMALDGFTQFFGWRESTWELRVITGLLFGGASVWLLYPRFDAAFGGQYAPDTACAPRLPTPRG
jgi:uncharacterized membrane protein